MNEKTDLAEVPIDERTFGECEAPMGQWVVSTSPAECCFAAGQREPVTAVRWRLGAAGTDYVQRGGSGGVCVGDRRE